jgi:hypothetical protein
MTWKIKSYSTASLLPSKNSPPQKVMHTYESDIFDVP